MRKENAFQVQFSQTSYKQPQTNHKRDSNPSRGKLTETLCPNERIKKGKVISIC